MPITIATVRNTRCIPPMRTLVHGVEKVGKTTFVCQAPAPIALDIEGRMGHLSVPAWRITSWAEALEALRVLAVEKHAYESVVVDSVTVLEKMMKEAIIEDSASTGEKWTPQSAEDFGRWIRLAVSTYWPRFFAACERLERERGTNILFTAHTQIRTVKVPSGEPYDRFRPNLGGDKGPELFLHWTHDTLYAAFEDASRRVKVEGRTRVLASTTGERVLHTVHRPTWDAGNSCGLPPVLPLDWDAYQRARILGLQPLEDQVKRAAAMCERMKDIGRRDAALAYLKSNAEDLGAVRALVTRIEEVLAEQDAEPEPKKE